jgi:hypothetical protein
MRKRGQRTAHHKQPLGGARFEQRQTEQLRQHVNAGPCPRPDKRRYVTKAEAKRHISKSALAARATLHAYRCECGGFHIGHRRAAPTTTEVLAS